MPIRRAPVKDASRVEFHRQKASAALTLGDRGEALEQFRAIVELDGEDHDARFQASVLTAAAGDPRAAADDAARVLEARPVHPEAWNLLGALLMKNGERAEAKACFKRAVELAPSFGLAVENLRDFKRFPKMKRGAPLVGEARMKRLLARREPRLTVGLIVRDEEDMLPDCLASARGVADEIVVADTGSRDRTAAIAREHGAVVFDHVWKDDFADARNAVVRRASGDWILMIDADERLDGGASGEEAGRELKRFLSNTRAGWATVEIDNVVGGKTMSFRAVRLFRNWPGVRYEGRIHEQVIGSLEALAKKFGISGAEAPLSLEHLGYEAEVFEKRGKGERNREMLAAELRHNPNNPYALLKQGEALFSVGRLEEAAPFLERAWILARQAGDQRKESGFGSEALEEPATLRAACSFGRGFYEEAIAACEELHALAGPTANTLYLRGMALFALDRDGAAVSLSEALELSGRTGALFTLPELHGASPRHALGSLALAAGDLKAAGQWFEEALEKEPGHRGARLGLAEILYRLGRVDGAVRMLASLAQEKPADPAPWRAGAVYLLSSEGQSGAASAWLQAGLKAVPCDDVLEHLATQRGAPGAAPAAAKAGPAKVGA